ncbi:MAG: PSD1 and planctomycete cytochrome C domain-containing protein [Planctomycetota bacterium]
MNRRIMLLALLACSQLSLVASAQQDVAAKPKPDHAVKMKAGTELFRETIRPALVANCLKCHGGEKVRSGFDLSTRKLLLQGGDSGEVVDLKEPGESYLLSLIRHDDEPAMPPAQEKLPDKLLADFTKWLELGAPYDKPLLEKREDGPKAMQVTESDRDFWAFRPLAKVAPPTVESDWPQNEIDPFIFAKLNANSLSPSPQVDDRTRVRRLYLDVIGLPPTPEQMQRGLEISHAALVDELLDSPHYGERWARHWLDAARFAESHGFEQDYDRKFAYHYRDFVIKALNNDMPWDQFVRWQIAGDELAPNEPLAMMATGFLGAGVFPTQLTEKEFESARYDELDDMAATVGTAMLGLTIGCARCHDHKFDPIPVKDYYRFVANFTTTIRSEVDVDLDPAGFQKKLAAWSERHSAKEARLAAYGDQDDVKLGFEKWLKTDAVDFISAQPWNLLDITSATSDQAATSLTEQEDGALLASGSAPAKEIYTIRGSSSLRQVRFVRIEALTHNSMKRNGPGRASNGNFALSNLVVFVDAEASLGKDEATWKPVKLKSARATHQQNTSSLSVEAAIDKDVSRTGWAVDFGGIGKDQAAVFALDAPIEISNESELEVRMTFHNNSQHSLGRFRVSLSDHSDPPVSVGDSQDAGVSAAIAALESGDLLDEHRKTLFPVYAAIEPEYRELQKAVEQSLAEKPKPQKTKVQVSSEGFPPTKHHADGRGFPHFYSETHFLSRGDPNQKLGVATSGFLQVLSKTGKAEEYWNQVPPEGWKRTSFRRASLANWLTDPEFGAGELLARVAVNRIWHHHFGRGIVATPNDFGLQGTPPTHPELLDFLAQDLIASGWSIKQLHRKILLSATWLQSNTASADKLKIDPENKWFWRFSPRRLEAEIVRDSMLAASGQLDDKMYGPGTLNPDQNRRSIYFMIKRSRLVPMMQIFDQPEPLSSQGSRPSTTIAPQALLFMNNRHDIGHLIGANFLLALTRNERK